MIGQEAIVKLFLLLSLFQINGVLAQEAAVDYSLTTNNSIPPFGLSLVPKASGNSFTNLTGSSLYNPGTAFSLGATRTNTLGLANDENIPVWHGITCWQQIILPFDTSLNPVKPGEKAAQMLACQNINPSKMLRFAVDNCNLKKECSKFILSLDKPDLSKIMIAPQFVAEDYLNYHIDTFSSQMEEIDRIREFVNNGPDKNLLPKNCMPKYIPGTKHGISIDNCNPTAMDEAYKKNQDKCMPGMRGCSFSSKDDGKSSINNWSTYNSSQGPTDLSAEALSRYEGYTKYKKDQSYTDINENDKSLIGKLHKIITNNDSQGIKLNKIFQILDNEKKKGLLDPVFSYTQESISSDEAVFKKSPHLNFFKQLIQASSKLNFNSIKNAFVKYRTEAAVSILQRDCENTPSFLEICSEYTAIQNGYENSAFWNASTYSKIKPNFEDEFNRYNELKTARPNGIKDLEDYNLIMDAQLCSTFGNGNVFLKKSTPPPPTSPSSLDYSSLLSGSNLNPDLEKQINQYYLNEYNKEKAKKFRESIDSEIAKSNEYWQSSKSSGSSSHLTNSPFNTKTYDKTKVDESENKAVSNNDNIKSASSIKETAEVTKGSDNVGTEIAKVKEISSENAVNGSGSGTTVSRSDIGGSTDVGSSMRNVNSPSTFSNQSYSNVNKKNGSSSEYVSSSSKTGNSSESNGNLSEKVNDLTRKLASSESNLEKFKAETKAAEEERARQAQAESDAKTIADLQAKLVEANADAKKPAITSSITDKVNSEPVPASFSISPKSIKSETGNKEKEVVAQNNPRDQEVRNNPVASSTIATPTSRNSNASAVSQSGVSSQMAYAPGDSRSSIVLTKMDGLTSENAVEKINEKITSLNGKPFYIEEGGIVKKIIPTIVNDVVAVDEFGKPIYEKIVVGNDEKIALTQGKSQAKAKRAPASISDKADLKRDQEERLKFERAEYLKLRNLTNGILNK